MLKKRLDLQLFASDELEDVVEPNNEGLDTTNEDQEGQDEKEVKDLLDMIEEDEDLKKQFQSEVDRMITRAIQTRDKKHQEELKKEKQRASMTAEEIQAEKERELQEREEQLRQYELKMVKIEYFKEHDLPLDLIDYVNITNEEEIEEKAQALIDIIDNKVKEEVQTRLKEDGVSIDNKESETHSLDDLSKLTTEEINSIWGNVE